MPQVKPSAPLELTMTDPYTGMEIVSPLDLPREIIPFPLNMCLNEPKGKLPEYTGEWIDAYLNYLEGNKSFCIKHKERHGHHFDEREILTWDSIINAYQMAIDRLVKVDFI